MACWPTSVRPRSNSSSLPSAEPAALVSPTPHLAESESSAKRRPLFRTGCTLGEDAVWVHPGSVGKLPRGGVSERPKEHASKACDG